MAIKLSLRSQITLLCTGLIVLTVLALLGTYWIRTGEFNQHQIDGRMNSARNVLEEYLLAKEKLLITAARVLTADFGFKQAVATRDSDTIASALENHGERIDADLMVLTNPEGEVLSASPRSLTERSALAEKIGTLPLRSEHSQFLTLDSALYQVMILPVRAPRLIAYTVVGFEIDGASLAEMQKLTGLNVTLLDDRGTIILSTFSDPAMARDALAQPDRDQVPLSLLPGRADFQHKTVRLENLAGIHALLSASLVDRHRQFDRLLLSILVIGLIILLVSLFLSQLLARGIARPLHRLVELAQQIGRGSFDMQPVRGASAVEFGELNQAFYTMGEEIQQRESEIKFQAQHDILTGLYNRHTFLDRLERLLQGDAPPVVVVGVNVRRFKQINDTMGPDIGDAVLWTVAGRIKQFLGVEDRFADNRFAGRISADDFLLVLPMPSEHTVAHTIERLHEVLSVPCAIDDLRLSLSICVVYATSETSTVAARDLLRRVTIAMSAAKAEQRRIRAYHSGEDEEYLYRLHLVEQLKKTLEYDDGQLFLHYQPKLNLRTQRVDKAEALIRWINRDEQFISPELFIDLAEQSGLIIRLTRWVIDQVLSQLADWNRRGFTLTVSINVSAQDIAHDGFIEYFLQALQRHGVAARQVSLEITERDLMETEVQAIDRLNQLKAIGLEVSVDDYGIGQSSLSKLKQLPVDELKIDKSFIITLDQSDRDQDIVSSTISLGHKLGMRVVAEGVENQASLNLLTGMQCDHVQGYYLSRPVSPDQFIDWLDAYEKSA